MRSNRQKSGSRARGREASGNGSETSSRCPPGAAIGNGNQVVGHKLIAEQVGVDAFAPGLNGLNGGREAK